jgi:hypothetical protein
MVIAIVVKRVGIVVAISVVIVTVKVHHRHRPVRLVVRVRLLAKMVQHPKAMIIIVRQVERNVVVRMIVEINILIKETNATLQSRIRRRTDLLNYTCAMEILPIGNVYHYLRMQICLRA